MDTEFLDLSIPFLTDDNIYFNDVVSFHSFIRSFYYDNVEDYMVRIRQERMNAEHSSIGNDILQDIHDINDPRIINAQRRIEQLGVIEDNLLDHIQTSFSLGFVFRLINHYKSINIDNCTINEDLNDADLSSDNSSDSSDNDDDLDDDDNNDNMLLDPVNENINTDDVFLDNVQFFKDFVIKFLKNYDFEAFKDYHEFIDDVEVVYDYLSFYKSRLNMYLNNSEDVVYLDFLLDSIVDYFEMYNDEGFKKFLDIKNGRIENRKQRRIRKQDERNLIVSDRLRYGIFKKYQFKCSYRDVKYLKHNLVGFCTELKYKFKLKKSFYNIKTIKNSNYKFSISIVLDFRILRNSKKLDYFLYCMNKFNFYICNLKSCGKFKDKMLYCIDYREMFRYSYENRYNGVALMSSRIKSSYLYRKKLCSLCNT